MLMSHNKCFFSFLQTEQTCVCLLLQHFSAQLDRSMTFLYVLSIMHTPVAFACCGCCNLLIALEKQTSRAYQVQISPDSLEPHHKKNKTKQNKNPTDQVYRAGSSFLSRVGQADREHFIRILVQITTTGHQP